MKLSRRIVAVLTVQLLSVFAVFASTFAIAERQEQQSLRWKKQVIQIAVSSSLTQPSTNIKTNSDVIGALSRSLDEWSRAANIEFRLVNSEKQSVSSTGRFGDGISLITIAQSPENLLFFARDPFSEAARTRVFYNKKGFIIEADIVLNPFQQFSSDGTYGTFDLETTFAHEIGHLLGLKHSAVIGSLMSDKVERNTTQKTPNFEAALLSESDVSSIRNLYDIDDEACCGTVTGKLLLQSGKSAKQTVVWAEDSESGMIVGQSETNADGSFRIGGLKDGEFSVFWQRKERDSNSSFGELGITRIEKNTAAIVTQKITTTRSDTQLTHIGTGMQLGDSAVELKAGGEYRIVIGGKNLTSELVTFEFNSPYLQAQSDSLRIEDFGDLIEAVSFVIKIDREIAPGTYSIYGRDRDGRRTVMIGALSVRNLFKIKN